MSCGLCFPFALKTMNITDNKFIWLNWVTVYNKITHYLVSSNSSYIFFFWPLCFLFYIDIRILIAPLIPVRCYESRYGRFLNYFEVWVIFIISDITLPIKTGNVRFWWNFYHTPTDTYFSWLNILPLLN